MNNTLVSVCMITYNHESYIRNAIEGVLMQKCSFDFELVIGEDFSTDNTREICVSYAQKYTHIIKLILHNHNVGMIPNLMNTTLQCNGKYIAFCEGDDYWTDPYKLEKQYNLLESNNDIGLVFSDFDILIQSNGRIIKSVFKNYPSKYPIYLTLNPFLINAGYMAPCTWMCRKELIPDIENSVSDGSFVWFLNVLSKSKVIFLDESTAVYRVLSASASHSNSAEKNYSRWQGILKTQFFFIEKYNLGDTVKDTVTKKYYRKILADLIILKKTDILKLAIEHLSFSDNDKMTSFLIFCSKFPFGNRLLQFYLWIIRLLKNSKVRYLISRK